MECIKMGKVTATVVMNVEMTDAQMEKLFREVLGTKREKFLQTKLALFGDDVKGTVEYDMYHRKFLFYYIGKHIPLSSSVHYTVDDRGYEVAEAAMTDEDYYLLKALDALEVW